MKYMLDLGIWGSVFAVPTQIVDRHLKLCGAAQLKVLLTLLRHSGEDMELSELAAALNLNTADTQDALNYWLQCGVLAARETTDGSVLCPAPRTEAPAGPIPMPAAAKAFAPAAAASFTPPAAPTANAAAEGEPPPPARANHAPPVRPKPLEIQQMAATDSNLKAFLAEAEASLGKLLTSSDVSTLVSLYSWAGIPADVLLTVICYCKSIDKTNLRYIEKVAVSWQERGIDTLEKADDYLREANETDTQSDLVMAAFGIHGRSLTAKETAYVRRWFGEFHFDLPLLRLAYERAVDNTGKVSFPYIGKILESWHEKNIKTPEEVARAEEAHSRKRVEKTASSFDIDEIEERLFSGSPKLNWEAKE